MLVKILSDIHLRPLSVEDFRYIDHGERVLILAGDISEGMRGVIWAERYVPHHIDVLYVPGNHEYYGQEYLYLNQWFKDYNEQNTQVRVLLNEVVDICGYKFAGSTLWTDFRLYNDPMSPVIWKNGLNDHRWIKYGDRHIEAQDILNLNAESLKFLSEVEADVLITHYGVPQSEHQKWAGHVLTPGFLTNIPQEIHQKFKLHVHGHTHDCWDYTLPYGTRVVCNPRGYGYENPHFNEELVINI